MKLRNKRTGEIIELLAKPSFVKRNDDYLQSEINTFNSLAELESEWEDYEEPKEYWFIDAFGNVIQNRITKHRGDEYTDMSDDYERQKQIGNYFGTEEEAEKVVDKLKAWKRLKDKGLHVTTFYVEDGSLVIRAKTHNSSGAENWEDLDLLFRR